MRIIHFAHDLTDPAVHRMLRLLRCGGATDLRAIGFRRRGPPVTEVAGIDATDLGPTEDGRLAARAVTLLRAARGGAWRAALAGADVVIARNLDTLALAALACRIAAPRAALVYECLDIHRLMVARGPVGAALRALEGRLLRRTALLIVSSPGFLRGYFNPVHGSAVPRSWLLENRPLAEEAPAAPPQPPPPGPPWRIGWFGNLSCLRSLELLAALARALPGRVEVVLRGRPTPQLRAAVPAVAARTPGLVFLGPYDRARDLAQIHAGLHFAWALDFDDAGTNSAWLLPNRLYESTLHGVVPIALATDETGRWLAAHGAGLLLEEPLEQTVPARLAALDAAGYAQLAASVAAIPRAALVADASDCAALVSALAPRR